MIVLLAAGAMLVLCNPVRAANKYWAASSGDWSTSSNWSGGEPSTDDDAYIQNGGTASITGTHTEYAQDLYINSSSQLTISGGWLNMSPNGHAQYVGHSDYNTGTIVQTGGTNSVGYNLYLGYGDGSYGEYDFSGSSTHLWVDDTLYVGNHGDGVFYQNGGTVEIDGHLELGRYSGSSGTYRLNDSGTLTVDGSSGIQVGVNDGAYGRLEWFSEGGITADTIEMGANGTLAIGYDFSEVPAIVDYLQLATLEVTNGATVTKNDTGTSQVTTLRFGSSTGAGYGLQQSGLVDVIGNTYVGQNGVGIATQTGGTFQTYHLYLGRDLGQGTYRLKGGTLHVESNIFDGTGTSTVVLDGGTLTLDGTIFSVDNLTLADEQAGSWTLSGSRTLTVGSHVVGKNFSGTFNQSGGTNNATTLTLGQNSGGNGTYKLTGGVLNAGQVVDGAGVGTLQIDGGTFAPTGSVDVDYFKVGMTAAGSHTQSGNVYDVGVLTLGNGTYRLTGGTLNASSVTNTTGTGTLNIDGGTFTPAGNVAVDNFGVGILSAGAHVQTDPIYSVGDLTLGNGAYTLSGGTLAVTGDIVNGSGAGTLALNGGVFQPGGSVSVDNLQIGSDAAASYTLSSGTWQAAAVTFGVGSSGAGTLTLSPGGTLDVSGTVSVGAGAGTLVLNGGTLDVDGNVTVTDLKVGLDVTASFTQPNKQYVVQNDLVVGSGSGNGTYRLQQTADLQVDGRIRVGQNGGVGRFEWYRNDGLTGAMDIELGAGSTLALGANVDVDDVVGTVTGLEDATLEITCGATASQDVGTVAALGLRIGGADGAGTYRLEDTAELSITPGAGKLIVGAAGQSGRLEWYRSGGLTTPLLDLQSTSTLAMGYDFEVPELLSGSLFGGGTLLGAEQTTLEITKAATALQNAGDAQFSHLRLGSGGNAGTYRIEMGNLDVQSLVIGEGGPGLLDIADADANVRVSQTLLFGPQASLSAAAGSRITLTGSDVLNFSSDPNDLADLANLTLAFQPEDVIIVDDHLEVGGEDKGPTIEGFSSNFALGGLVVGKPEEECFVTLHLMDDLENSGPPPEALYVHDIYVYEGAVLDMNSLNVYYDGVLYQHPGGDIINGTPQYVPEPGTWTLLVVGGLFLFWRRRR